MRFSKKEREEQRQQYVKEIQKNKFRKKLFVVYDGRVDKFLNKESREWNARNMDNSDFEKTDFFLKSELPCPIEEAELGIVYQFITYADTLKRDDFLENAIHWLNIKTEEMRWFSGNSDSFINRYCRERLFAAKIAKFGHTVIENWFLKFGGNYLPPEDHRWLYGNVFNHHRKPDGSTTRINMFKGLHTDENTVIGQYGGVYKIGEPAPEYESLFPNARFRFIRSLLPPDVSNAINK